jgi:leader peptidase (prepilin peptidase)/N-methyltransferase
MLLAGRRMGATSRLPFGPFLALSAWAMWIAIYGGWIDG